MFLQRIAYIGLIVIVLLVVAEQLHVIRMHRPSETPVIRIACASWQKGEMPFESFVQAYRQVHPKLDIQIKMIPPQSENKLIMLWRQSRTPYDIVIAYADEEIHTFIEMGVLADVQTLLTAEQMAEFLPASMAGSSSSKSAVNGTP